LDLRREQREPDDLADPGSSDPEPSGGVPVVVERAVLDRPFDQMPEGELGREAGAFLRRHPLRGDGAS